MYAGTKMWQMPVVTYKNELYMNGMNFMMVNLDSEMSEYRKTFLPILFDITFSILYNFTGEEIIP